MHNEWDSPCIAVNLPPPNVSIVAGNFTPSLCTEQLFDDLIDEILQSLPVSSGTYETQLTNSNIAEAYANFITDVTVEESSDSTTPSPRQVQAVLKDLQPYREKPSKDCSRRFAVGELPLNAELNASYDVQNYQYWTLYPTNAAIKSAKVFILSQIICVRI